MPDDDETKRAIAYRTISEEEWRVMKPDERIHAIIDNRVPPDSVLHNKANNTNQENTTNATSTMGEPVTSEPKKKDNETVAHVKKGVALFLVIAVLSAIPLSAISTYLVRIITPPQAVPIGAIIAWNGKGQLPDGWAICDGNKDTGTPDLRGLFLMGVATPSDANMTDKVKIMTRFIDSPGGADHLSCVDLPAPFPRTSAPPAQINIPPNYTVIYLMKVK